jgi:hypothetical protein
MPKVYKIHPAIGIARVGNSPDAFFIGPEIPGQPPSEIVGDAEQPVTRYKDEGGFLKRQAARFRIFEYEQQQDGTLAPTREITAAEATIQWSVSLANRKPAAKRFTSDDLRNPGIAEDELVIAPQFAPISGTGQRVTAAPEGQFRGQEVYLGELQTDSSGRLLVLGGRGLAGSLPPNLPVTHFADNPGWYDDVSDGPVTATVALPGEPPHAVEHPAWVIVAPPDFAPSIDGIVTLYDLVREVAVKRGWIQPPAQPSFRRHIFPILRRATDLRWVGAFPVWSRLSRDWKRLSDLRDPTATALRKETANQMLGVREGRFLVHFRYTTEQHRFLEQLRDGDFVDDWDQPADTPVAVTPDGLDRAALEPAVGGGFWPGIEACLLITWPDLYTEPFRLTHQPLAHPLAQTRFGAGSLTERLAVPWQADFRICDRTWWPAQRPDTVLRDLDAPAPDAQWSEDLEPYETFMRNLTRLGFVVPRTNSAGESVYVETERDPALSR